MNLQVSSVVRWLRGRWPFGQRAPVPPVSESSPKSTADPSRTAAPPATGGTTGDSAATRSGSTEHPGEPGKSTDGAAAPSTRTDPVTLPVFAVLDPVGATPVLTVVFRGSTAKDPGLQSSNEDTIAIATGRAAVFDGATESFAARRWARLLAAHWRTGEPDWVARARASYDRAIATVPMSWAQEAASARGSFATIAWIRAVPGGLQLGAVGDSCVLFLRDNAIVHAYPFVSSSAFTSAPQALASAGDLAAATQELLDAAPRTVSFTAGRVDEVWLVTDAIAAWLLDPDPQVRNARVASVRALPNGEALRLLVHEQRAAGCLKTDDSTVVRLHVGDVT